MVEDYLQEHAADDLGPAGIGKELGRSSGAVANALERLVADGYAVMTSAKPKRYRFGFTVGRLTAEPATAVGP